MRGFVGVTDGDWFRLLKSLPDVDEVNFWQPGGSANFKALSPGEPFLFKLHSPDNFIVGGGFFATFSLLPASLAWQAFGVKNGVRSLPELRQRVEKYRDSPPNPRDDYQIGCIILQQPFFLERSAWVPIPADFSLNIVRGKGYALDTEPGRSMWEAARAGLRVASNEAREPAREWVLEDRMFGEPVLVRHRLGQGTFRVLVTDSYERRCAVTREHTLPVLEAAHIRPVTEGGVHRIDNGLLLRSDVHTLFDRGYVTVTPDYRFRVSGRLRDDFQNGRVYYELDGREVALPRSANRLPSRELLEWHGDVKFLG